MTDSPAADSPVKTPLIRSYRELMSDSGNRSLSAALVLHTVTGCFEGLALLAFLPLARTLGTGDTAWGMGTTGWLISLGVLAAIAFAVRYAEARVGYLAAVDFIRFAHHAIGDALAKLPLGWFDRRRTGRISSLVSHQFMTAGEGIAHLLPALVSGFATLLTVIAGLWVFDWRLGLILTVLAPLTVLLLWLSQRIKKTIDARTHSSADEVSSRIVEFATCQPALRAAGRSHGFAPLDDAAAEDTRNQHNSLWISSAALALGAVAVQLLITSGIVVSGLLALAGALAPLVTVAFIGVMLRFAITLQNLSNSVVGIEMGRIPLRQAREILTAETLPEIETASPLPKPGEVEFDRVSFGYVPESRVLEDFSMRIAAGTMTAVVGASGSGKSTAAALIARFWDVDSGTVRVGGTDIRDMPTSQLMAQLTMVFQDVYLFNDSLWSNVAMSDPDATDAEVYAAAELAGVTQIAEVLPHGWQTVVGEGGRSLSGGERQRVSIARALLKKAPIVLFDEATSALDGENEANVMRSVDELRRSSTVLVIAHKLETVQRADHIVVLDGEGGIAEEGTHEQLFAGGGRYREFWDKRASAQGWRLTQG
ncbi:ABC transporter ATP-binding protein/permease [Brevibacterium sediminis]|uniref:ABC transporter ATP-binding protein n=1 Tax=Brevibacterium sediminis TaxID=1857024 RepID=UPI0021754410|nr:ABC transporter ATP-binding protein [Brevibacterium sediminis]MCS4592282.1 ABC transporter ATP-binding protein/permease [Brevibacterium sediminis]